jgi:hypothetical protein
MVITLCWGDGWIWALVLCIFLRRRAMLDSEKKVLSMRRGLFNVTAFAIAMANVETMIVVYLRRLYYPDGFTFPLVIIDLPTLILELAREACTVVMLATFGIAAGRTKVGQFAYFLIGFGIWDIFYYVWLKVILNWPASLLTWDVLFLIPVPWIGPVLAPVSVACTMIGMGVVVLWLETRGPVLPAGTIVWSAQIVAACIIILSFTLDVLPRLDPEGKQLGQWIPVTYRWWMLGLGQVMAIGAFLHWVQRAMRYSTRAPRPN